MAAARHEHEASGRRDQHANPRPPHAPSRATAVCRRSGMPVCRLTIGHTRAVCTMCIPQLLSNEVSAESMHAAYGTRYRALMYGLFESRHVGVDSLSSMQRPTVCRSTLQAHCRTCAVPPHDLFPPHSSRVKSHSLNAFLNSSTSPTSSSWLCPQSCHCTRDSSPSSFAITLRPNCRSNRNDASSGST